MTHPETPQAEFTKKETPELRKFYSQEKVETVPYVTIWEGAKLENECDFENSACEFITIPEIEAVREQLIAFQTKGKNYRDDPKSRLASIKEENGRLVFSFQKVGYSDYIVTNMSMEVVLPGSNKSIREQLEPGPALTRLDESKCSNHLGVSCLVITADKKMILQKASQAKVTGARQITSSASGAMDWTEPNINPFEVIQSELYEELGLTNEETLYVTGIALSRELARGGKPEMFFILKTELTSDEILSRVATDPDKEVDQLFTIDLSQDSTERIESLSKLWEDQSTSQSTKASLYYLSRTDL